MKAGFVGLIGLPNSGKSTLMNAMVGEKVSIVTAKPQTTRRRVVGVVNRPDAQCLIVDAPGVVGATAGLGRFLKEEALDVIGQSDVLVAILSIDEPNFESLMSIVDMVKDSGKPYIIVIQKTDLPELHRPQILRDKLKHLGVPILQGSALQQSSGLAEMVMDAVVPLLPESAHPLYDADLYTLSSVRDLSAEIIREKCFEKLHQEVPFGLAVRILSFQEDEGPTVRVEAEILVAKDNHRPIVIGREGQTLKGIGTEARLEIQKLVDRKVFLDLKVITRRNWQKNPAAMKDLGYVVQPS
ncbi:MAG: GTPase Era [Bdellovibrionales bacterium]